jgi:hypothetical protein
MEAKEATMKTKRNQSLPLYLRGAYAEDIARILGVSLEVAHSMKAATATKYDRVGFENACVSGEAKSDEIR